MATFLEAIPLAGLDVVRARVALRLSAELDSGGAPGYTLARLSSELRAVLVEIEANAGTVGSEGSAVADLLAVVG